MFLLHSTKSYQKIVHLTSFRYGVLAAAEHELETNSIGSNFLTDKSSSSSIPIWTGIRLYVKIRAIIFLLNEATKRKPINFNDYELAL